MQKGFSENPWNKCKLQNRYRARWAKGKTDIGLDKHCTNSEVYYVLCAVGVLRFLLGNLYNIA